MRFPTSWTFLRCSFVFLCQRSVLAEPGICRLRMGSPQPLTLPTVRALTIASFRGCERPVFSAGFGHLTASLCRKPQASCGKMHFGEGFIGRDWDNLRRAPVCQLAGWACQSRLRWMCLPPFSYGCLAYFYRDQKWLWGRQPKEPDMQTLCRGCVGCLSHQL